MLAICPSRNPDSGNFPVTLKRRTELVPRRPAAALAKTADAEVMLWTTRDGREIPLDEMSEQHMQNAIVALSRWRSRIRRMPGQEATAADIADAIARFKRTLRRRAKSIGSNTVGMTSQRL